VRIPDQFIVVEAADEDNAIEDALSQSDATAELIDDDDDKDD
jgi:hypothetical protein